jgi:hypothetical protein
MAGGALPPKNKYQKLSMAKGGRQPGAGRPKGSTNKVRVADFVNAKDRATFVEFMLLLQRVY